MARGLKNYGKSLFVQAVFLFHYRSLICLHSVVCFSVCDEGMKKFFSFKCGKQTNDSDVQEALKMYRMSKYQLLRATLKGNVCRLGRCI